MPNNDSAPEVKQTSQSTDKLLRILEALSFVRVPIRLQDLSEQVQMSQSTVLRYLYALQKDNYVYQEEDTSRYALTWKVCALSQNVNSLISLRSITSSYITRLVDELHLGACLVIEQNNTCVYLDCLDASMSIGATLTRIGKAAPLHTTGSGKVILSSYSDAAIDEYVSSSGLIQLTEHTITDPAVLKQEIAMTRQRGYAFDDEECEIGLRCVSMPLKNYAKQTIAAMSIFGSLDRMTEDAISGFILPKLQQVTQIVSQRLGCC